MPWRPIFTAHVRSSCRRSVTATSNRRTGAVFAEFRHFLKRSGESVSDVEFAMWMVATTAHAAIHNGVVERPNEVESGRLVDELVVLLMRYLKRPRVRAALLRS
jgi:tetracycline repressor-like protein